MSLPQAISQRKELGPYQLGLLLGKSGMGEVYEAFDTRLERRVAVKRLHAEANPKARQRFRREARTLAQLGHPAIIQICDVVTDEDGDWIVMELVDGPTLAELVRGGPLDVGLALDYTLQVIAALDCAHTSGVIHRDLKIENVMVAPGHRSSGREPPGATSASLVKVLDFGLASQRGLGLDGEVRDGLVFPGRCASVRVMGRLQTTTTGFISR